MQGGKNNAVIGCNSFASDHYLTRFLVQLVLDRPIELKHD